MPYVGFLSAVGMIAAGWDVAMATHEVFSSLVQVRR
jgi:hypothetical protein